MTHPQPQPGHRRSLVHVAAHTTTLCALALLACLASLSAADLPPDFDTPDSRFLPAEDHTETTVTDGPRKGWTERRDTIGFGAYSLSIVQRLDPATGLPAQEGITWGDAFVGLGGKRPAVYMASNWSPWDLLTAQVRLAGDDRPLPCPTTRGLLMLCCLREATADRVVGEAIWQDSSGGLLRARLVGWRAQDRFGLTLRYFPAEGRVVESLRYILTCQPYDYSDRGYWERRRFITTRGPSTEECRPEQRLELGLATQSRIVFHNRFAQSDSGTTLALDHAQLASASVTGHGVTITTALTPRDPLDEVRLIASDWVDEAWPLAAARFLASEDLVAARLADLATLSIPAPTWSDPLQASDLLALLDRYPQLRGVVSQATDVPTADRMQSLLADAASEGPARSARALVELAAAARSAHCLAQQIRGEWVRQKLWAP